MIRGLISSRMDWLNLLAVQGTLKSLLQHHSSKASVLWCSAFFMVQLSHPYMIIGKKKTTIRLTIQTFVCKIMWSEVKVTQLCLTLCDPMDYTVHEILQARILEWVAVPFSRGSSTQGLNPRLLHCRRILYQWSYQGSLNSNAKMHLLWM